TFVSSHMELPQLVDGIRADTGLCNSLQPHTSRVCSIYGTRPSRQYSFCTRCKVMQTLGINVNFRQISLEDINLFVCFFTGTINISFPYMETVSYVCWREALPLREEASQPAYALLELSLSSLTLEPQDTAEGMTRCLSPARPTREPCLCAFVTESDLVTRSDSWRRHRTSMLRLIMSPAWPTEWKHSFIQSLSITDLLVFNMTRYECCVPGLSIDSFHDSAWHGIANVARVIIARLREPAMKLFSLSSAVTEDAILLSSSVFLHSSKFPRAGGNKPL
ncbi:hypothetical protein JOB18_001704, partial [Solea senegalensis]